MFFRDCRHHSTKSAKWWGNLIPFALPLVCKCVCVGGGQLPPLPPPAPPPMVILHYNVISAFSSKSDSAADNNELRPVLSIWEGVRFRS